MIATAGELPDFAVRKAPPSLRLWWLMFGLWMVSFAVTGYFFVVGRSLSPAAVELVRTGQGCEGVAGCDEVLQSEYATFLGHSLTRWSGFYLLLMFATLVAAAFGGHDVRSPPAALLLPVVAAVGLSVAMWLVPVLLLRLGSSCLACLALHAANSLLFVCSLIYARQAWLHRQFDCWVSGVPPLPLWPRVMQAAGVCVMLVGIGLLLANFRAEPPSAYEPTVAPARRLETTEPPNFNWDTVRLDSATTSDEASQTFLGAADAPIRVVVFTCLTNRESARLHESLTALVEQYPDQLRIDYRFDPQWPGCNDNYANQSFDETHRDACTVARLAIAMGLVDQVTFVEFIDWAFANQDKLNDARATAEARYLAGEAKLATVRDSRPVWARATTDIELAGDLKPPVLPSVYVDDGAIYGGVDASSLRQFLSQHEGLPAASSELPETEPVWLGEASIVSHARSGVNFFERRRYDEAIAELRLALQLRPHWPEVAAQLAWLLATCPDEAFCDGEQAVYYARLAAQQIEQRAKQTGRERMPPVYYEVLAAAYARADDFEESIPAADKAVDGYLIDQDKLRATIADEHRSEYLKHEPITSSELKPAVDYITAK